MNNKEIFAANLKKYMLLNNKSRNDICDALDFNYYTLTDWVKGKKFPRMDKVQKLADYFGIMISDLIEDKELEEVDEKNNSLIAKVVIRMQNDPAFSEVVGSLYGMDEEKLKSVLQLVTAFNK